MERALRGLPRDGELLDKLTKRNRSSSTIDQEVGRRIKTRRLEIGLTQSALGNALNLTFQQIQKYENGKNRVGAGRLHQIAKALDVPVAFFFASTDEASGVSEIAELVDTTYSLRLLKAFSRLKNAGDKRIFVELIERVADGPAKLKN